MLLNPSDVIGTNGSTASNIEIPDISAAVSRDKINKRLGYLYIVEIIICFTTLLLFQSKLIYSLLFLVGLFILRINYYGWRKILFNIIVFILSIAHVLNVCFSFKFFIHSNISTFIFLILIILYIVIILFAITIPFYHYYLLSHYGDIKPPIADVNLYPSSSSQSLQNPSSIRDSQNASNYPNLRPGMTEEQYKDKIKYVIIMGYYIESIMNVTILLFLEYVYSLSFILLYIIIILCLACTLFSYAANDWNLKEFRYIILSMDLVKILFYPLLILVNLPIFKISNVIILAMMFISCRFTYKQNSWYRISIPLI